MEASPRLKRIAMLLAPSVSIMFRRAGIVLSVLNEPRKPYSKLSGSSSALEMPITIVNTPASLSVLDEASTSLDIGLLIQMEILSTVTSFVATLAASSVEEVVS